MRSLQPLGNETLVEVRIKLDNTVMRVFEKDVSTDRDTLTVGGRKVLMTEEKDPAKIPWGKLGVDVVVESTGVLLTREKLQGHLAAGQWLLVTGASS